MKILVALCLIGLAVAQMDQPNPYSFSYKMETEDGGSSSHQEEGDGNGRVSGSFTITNLEGHTRTVEYVADENGFRPTIRTNEPGTANLNPADVIMDSSADSGMVSLSGTGAGAGGAGRPAVVVRPQVPSGGGRAGTRYVLVPATDPRARGYL